MEEHWMQKGISYLDFQETSFRCWPQILHLDTGLTYVRSQFSAQMPQQKHFHTRFSVDHYIDQRKPMGIEEEATFIPKICMQNK